MLVSPDDAGEGETERGSDWTGGVSGESEDAGRSTEIPCQSITPHAKTTSTLTVQNPFGMRSIAAVLPFCNLFFVIYRRNPAPAGVTRRNALQRSVRASRFQPGRHTRLKPFPMEQNLAFTGLSASAGWLRLREPGLSRKQYATSSNWLAPYVASPHAHPLRRQPGL